MKNRKIKICPVCKSADITLDMAGQSGKYLCKNCGYTGVLVIERNVNVSKESPKTEENKE